MSSPRYLSIYVNDHLAALTAVRDLARRTARSNRGTELGAYLAGVVDELQEAQGELIGLTAALGVRRDPFKRFAAWAAEKGGRLKLNGHVFTYSPLSRVLEIEGLLAGTELELRTWRALEGLAGRSFAGRAQACERRRDVLAGHHLAAVEAALGRTPSSPTQ